MAIFRRVSIKSISCSFALLVVACSSSAQTQPEKSKKPGIAVRSEVVLVPAVVTDHAGVHVSGLTQGDFTVLENGQQQKIAFFHHIQANTAPDDAATPVQPGECTNKVQTRSERSAILVFDLLN